MSIFLQLHNLHNILHCGISTRACALHQACGRCTTAPAPILPRCTVATTPQSTADHRLGCHDLPTSPWRRRLLGGVRRSYQRILASPPPLCGVRSGECWSFKSLEYSNQYWSQLTTSEDAASLPALSHHLRLIGLTNILWHISFHRLFINQSK